MATAHTPARLRAKSRGLQTRIIRCATKGLTRLFTPGKAAARRRRARSRPAKKLAAI
jgi:hypothetical protein